MARATALQLSALQVGAGSTGLFSHQGGCEHRLVVLDLRLLHASDPRHWSAYPLALAQPQRINNGRCQVCNVALAALVVVDDPEAPCSPCQMCAGCHEMLGAEEQGLEGLRRGPGYRVFPLRD
jgi:snRNA-activating protein complex subunit 3